VAESVPGLIETCRERMRARASTRRSGGQQAQLVCVSKTLAMAHAMIVSVAREGGNRAARSCRQKDRYVGRWFATSANGPLSSVAIRHEASERI